MEEGATTKITEKMIEYGTLYSVACEAKIYRHGDKFFYQVVKWTPPNGERQRNPSESSRHDSLLELLLDLPFGFLFTPKKFTDKTVEAMLKWHDAVRDRAAH